MGVKDSDITHLAQRRHLGVADDRPARRVAEAAGLLYTGTDDGVVAVSRDGGKTWTNVIDRMPGLPDRASTCRRSCRRGSTRARCTSRSTPSAERLRHLHLGEQRLRADVPSIDANLKGEVVRTLTEDPKNPDVLYLGTETGIFVTLDRGKSWRRLKAEPPDRARRRDHAPPARQRDARRDARPRDLDARSPRADPGVRGRAEGGGSDAKLFTPPPTAMYRRPTHDRNDEFWGDQTFFGENPPQAAV